MHWGEKRGGGGERRGSKGGEELWRARRAGDRSRNDMIEEEVRREERREKEIQLIEY